MWYENEVNEIVGYDKNGVKLACIQLPMMSSDTVNMEHTEMDPSLQRQGVGGELMEQLARHLRDEKKKAILTCPCAQHWFDGHSESKGLVTE